MKRDWNEAISMLKDNVPNSIPSLLKAHCWIGSTDARTEYYAYIESVGHSQKYDNPIDAVKDILAQYEEFKSVIDKTPDSEF
jgi:hypothetical protein